MLQVNPKLFFLVLYFSREPNKTVGFWFKIQILLVQPLPKTNPLFFELYRHGPVSTIRSAFRAPSFSGFMVRKVILSWKNTRSPINFLTAQHVPLIPAAEEQWVTTTTGDRESWEEISDRIHGKGNNRYFHKQGGESIKLSWTKSKVSLCHQKQWRVHQKPAEHSIGDKRGLCHRLESAFSIRTPPRDVPARLFWLSDVFYFIFFTLSSQISYPWEGESGEGRLIAFL